MQNKSVLSFTEEMVGGNVFFFFGMANLDLPPSMLHTIFSFILLFYHFLRPSSEVL